MTGPTLNPSCGYEPIPDTINDTPLCFHKEVYHNCPLKDSNQHLSETDAETQSQLGGSSGCFVVE